ncbi:NAD(P)/FAD-dependent oxidoreductase [Peptostreptococcus faecalis]|uniref:NAD(P)/FAD-dependent oxidoreductase n=1 Tax=Peptostreptococcus faecalis TaxID=2045015 RepID=UPI000C7DDA3B|nr:NAD(P)/FAD-dependent oxidoreductase [Peptostreptococcus faecalis]
MKYSKLFSPGKIGDLEIQNRVIMSSMGCSMANVDGTPSEQMISYYEKRARGGVGLICTEVTRINDEHGIGEPAQLSVSHDEVILGLSKLADAVHKHGTKIFVQLHHPGNQTGSAAMYGVQPVAPSAVTCPIVGEEPRVLSTEEVKGLIQDYIDGAWRAQQAGIDGVEIHGAHGYLINQFFSKHTNKRTDQYGGSLENRVRMAVEIIEGIRKRCGSDFPVTIRVTVEEFMGDEGIQLDEGVEICKLLEKAGVDAIGVTSGIYESMNTIVEPLSYDEGWRVYLTEKVKNAVKIPVYGNGVIRHPDFAEKLIEEGKMDFIGMGRPHLADPEWCFKAKNDQADRIRYCVSCLRCFESVFSNSGACVPIECSVNAQLGKESRYPYYAKDGKNRTVVIIGGGPAGLESARVLAERRFKPILFELTDVLGGNVAIGKNPPGKEKLGWFIDYLKTELDRLGVDIRMNTKVDIDKIEKLNPYAIILATGSVPIIPKNIPGVFNENVYNVPDILSGKIQLRNKKVAVIGSGMTGIELAEMLASQGNEVSVIEMAKKIAPDGYWQSVMDVLKHLQEYNVKLMPEHKLLSIEKDRVKLEGETTELLCDEVVLALGVKSENSLCQELKSKFDNVYNIGDSHKVGKIVNAVSDAFVLCNNL